MLHIEVSAEQQNKHPPYTALLTFVQQKKYTCAGY